MVVCCSFFAAVGGLMAYIKKGSEKSILAASAVATLLFISASLMGHPTYRVGTLLALGMYILLLHQHKPCVFSHN